MELKFGVFRAHSAKELDEMLGIDGEITILVRRRPRFVVSQYKPQVNNKKTENGTVIVKDTILDTEAFLGNNKEENHFGGLL